MEFFFKSTDGTLYRRYDSFDFGSIDTSVVTTVSETFDIGVTGFNKPVSDLGIYLSPIDKTSNTLSLVAEIARQFPGQYGMFVEQNYVVTGQCTENSATDTEVIDSFLFAPNIPYYITNPSSLIATSLAIVDGTNAALTTSSSIDTIVGYNTSDIIKYKINLSTPLLDINTSLSYVPVQNELYKITVTAKT